MRLRFPPSTIAIILLIVFTILNPLGSLDLAAFLVIGFILIHKMFGDYVILVLLALRPAIDYWRDVVIFSSGNFTFNLNAGISVILLLWSGYFLLKNYDDWKTTPLRVPWILFILWCTLSFIYTYDHSATISETLKAANLFTLFIISFILRRRDGEAFTKQFLMSLGMSAVIPFTLALYQLLTRTGLTIDEIPNRIYGTFAHPNILATFALLIIMVLIHEAVIKHAHWTKYYPLATRAALGLSVVILTFTYTRIAWIGLAVFLFLIGLLFYRRLTLIATVAAVASYILFFPFNTFLKTNFNYNLQSISLVARLTARSAEADSIKWRADLFNKILPLWYERPIIGYGYGAFAKVWNDNKGIQNIWDSTSEAHNDYLKVGFEVGAIGLLLFLSIFVTLGAAEFKLARGHEREHSVFLVSILVYLILSASDNMLHHTPVIWWLWALWGMWRAEKNLGNKQLAK